MGGASIAANLSNVRFLEHPMGGASIPANLSNVRFLEHPMGRASIPANLSSVRFLEHPMGGESIPANLSSVRFLEHPMGGASIAANLSNVRFADESWPVSVARMGKVGCSPASFLQLDQDSAWLFDRAKRPLQVQKPHERALFGPERDPSNATLSLTNALENVAPASQFGTSSSSHNYRVRVSAPMERCLRAPLHPL